MNELFEWERASPETQGMDGEKLDAMWRELEKRRTRVLLIVRNDRIVYEKYAGGWHEKRKHYTASLAKALVGGLSLMLAVDDRLLSIDDRACRYIPQWRDHPLKRKITIRHLATHSSGIEDASEEGKSHEELTGWKGDFWRQIPDPFTISRDQAPVIFEPGTAYHYSNPGMAMLAYAVTASLKKTPYKDIRTLLKKRVMEPIGISEDEWFIGYGKTFHVDGLDLVANWGGGGFTARAVARIGRLMLRKGDWEGRQIISPARVVEATSYAGTPLPPRWKGNPSPASGLGWYVNFDRVWRSVPPDAFAGAGAGHQILVVVPSLDLILVRFGDLLDDGDNMELEFWGLVEKYLLNPLIGALIQPPYPRSSVIEGIEWAPASSIIRLATGGSRRDGSDNWPLTWADDNHIYTAYGDGYGFEPGVPRKLGLGFAVIIGHPETGLTCLNIRSNGENTLFGKSGKKASGMLMVDGVLYMWARNAEDGYGSQLAWSTDYAKTWRWCDWKFREFGYPTFINFGKNYEGARDNYVYIISHDNPSAYEPADHFVLMRVPKDRITDRSAYEFFVKLDENNNPVWSKDIDQRGPVFKNPGRCRRSSIVYNAPLQRYLWWQELPSEDKDSRFEGGFGIYDAPEPWGPWTTVYFTERWDVGPGETGSFPSKWISHDGKTLYLVFSGNDNFSIRKAHLILGREDDSLGKARRTMISPVI